VEDLEKQLDALMKCEQTFYSRWSSPDSLGKIDIVLEELLQQRRFEEALTYLEQVGHAQLGRLAFRRLCSHQSEASRDLSAEAATCAVCLAAYIHMHGASSLHAYMHACCACSGPYSASLQHAVSRLCLAAKAHVWSWKRSIHSPWCSHAQPHGGAIHAPNLPSFSTGIRTTNVPCVNGQMGRVKHMLRPLRRSCASLAPRECRAAEAKPMPVVKPMQPSLLHLTLVQNLIAGLVVIVVTGGPRPLPLNAPARNPRPSPPWPQVRSLIGAAYASIKRQLHEEGRAVQGRGRGAAQIRGVMNPAFARAVGKLSKLHHAHWDPKEARIRKLEVSCAWPIGALLSPYMATSSL
jgi:hypothetical protein